MGTLTGPGDGLLSFDEVERALHSRSQVFRGTQAIPVDAIVGSVGRYRDFDRAFTPLLPQLQARLIQVGQLAELDPIDVYRVGEVYFVRDGNHRVSVARRQERDTIAARVTEIPTRVPLTPEMSPEQVLNQAAYSHFLDSTNLDRTRPDGIVKLEGCPDHPTLLLHIEVHRYYMGHAERRDVSLDEAASSWFDNVYLPVYEALQSSGALREFPQRSPAELYLWVAYHRERIKCSEPEEPAPTDEQVANRLTERFSDRPWSRVVKTVLRVVRAAVQAAAERPEPPGRPAL